MRAILAIAAVELRRFLADKANIFFAFVFPLLLVLVLGIQSGGGPAGRVALVGEDSSLQVALEQAMTDAGLEVRRTDADQMRTDLARGTSHVGLVVTAEASAAADAAAEVPLEIVTSGESDALAVAQLVRTATATALLQGGAERTLVDVGASPEEARSALARAQDSVAPATVLAQDTSELEQEYAGISGATAVSSGMVLLFVFINTLSGGASTLIQMRRDGIVRRTLAAPVTAGQTIGGIALGRLALALFQGLYIVVATRLLFDVQWGDLWAVAAVLVCFGLVAAGAAIVVGSLLDNEGAASGLSVGLSLVLAALGGAMVPLELFPDSLRRAAQFTPHGWGYEALAAIQRHGAGVGDVLPELGALAGMAAAALLLGGLLLRRSVARAM